MSSKLPLKVRVDIRDIWNAKDKDLRLAVEDLAKVLGYTIEPEVEWLDLWASTSAGFPDNNTFIPSIARFVVSWYRQLAARVERDSQSEWTEELLENFKQARSGHSSILWVQPSASTTNIVQSRWDKVLKKFYMEVPKNVNPQMSGVDYDFERDFDGFFSAGPTPVVEDLPGSVMEEPRIEGDTGDWADIVVETHKAPGPPPAAPAKAAPIPKPMRMPTVETTPRPSDLLKNLAPHYLIFNSSAFPAWIQCSYEPTLNFLVEYLNRHGKTNTNDSLRRQIYKVELRESSFCHSLRDSMIIDLHMNYRGQQSINPTLILSLIEGVLGYKRVDFSDGCWIFRHETGFI